MTPIYASPWVSTKSGQLQGFFEGLKTEADLEQFVKDEREEDLYLEFKQKHDTRDGELADDDRKNFSKAVSGFANADGGVLIFGVETKKSPDHPDRAAKLKPIPNVERFRARLLDSTLNTTQPAVDRISIDVVPGAQGGYVKCLIPASDKPPHRAMVGREYWRRASTGFRRMEHYELEEVFGRRLRPVLHMQLRLDPRPEPDPSEDLFFYILNVGRGVAKHVGFHCDIHEGRLGGVSPRLSNVTTLNEGRPSVSYYEPTAVVHPNGIWLAAGRMSLMRAVKGGPLPFTLTWYAEEAVTRRQDGEVRPEVPVTVT